MTDPNLPEGVTQKDIDATVGETFDPDLCEHWDVICENCETSMEFLYARNERLKRKVKEMWEVLEEAHYYGNCHFCGAPDGECHFPSCRIVTIIDAGRALLKEIDKGVKRG